MYAWASIRQGEEPVRGDPKFGFIFPSSYADVNRGRPIGGRLHLALESGIFSGRERFLAQMMMWPLNHCWERDSP